MDYKELAKNLMICAAVESGCICPGEYKGEVCSGPREESGDCMRMDKLAATAITELLDRAEAAEARCKIMEERANRWEEEVKACGETELAKAHEALSADWAKHKIRVKELETRLETAEKIVTEYQDVIVPGYRDRAEKAEAERDAAVSDMEALMWHSGDGCNVCANAIVVHREPYVRIDCALKGQECKPKWRGAKEELA